MKHIYNTKKTGLTFNFFVFFLTGAVLSDMIAHKIADVLITGIADDEMAGAIKEANRSLKKQYMKP